MFLDLSRRVVTIREPADEREDLAVAAVVCDSQGGKKGTNECFS